MKILATNSYSGGGQFTEGAQRGSGLSTFCLANNIFDTNPTEDIERLFATAKKEKVKAVIIDNHWMANDMMSISHGQVDFARRLHALGIETFFLGRGDHDSSCELWRAHKPCFFQDMKEPVLQIAKIGEFGMEVFWTKDNSVLVRSGGDGGDETVAHCLRQGYAYRERDWPKIVKAVKKELSS